MSVINVTKAAMKNAYITATAAVYSFRVKSRRL